MRNPKFSIVIANFNGEKYLSDCLASVFKTSYPSYEVIIIEDGSTDSSLGMIEDYKRKFALTLIQNESNLGLVKSRNKAIKFTSGDLLVFLDNDTKVDKNWLKGLEETFLSDKTIGAAQCKMFDFKKKNTIQEIGMKLNPYTGFGMPLERGKKDRGQFEKEEDIIALGAALVVKKEVVEKIGGFDQKLFHYTDDLDFSWRVWISGYRVVLAPNAKVYHYTKEHNPNYRLYFHLSKNSIRMMIKNYEVSNIIKYLPFSLIFNILGGLSVLFKKRSLSAILGVLLGICWSIVILFDSLKERSRVQRLRKARDKDIFNKIMISTNIFNIYKLYFKTEKTSVALMENPTKA